MSPLQLSTLSLFHPLPTSIKPLVSRTIVSRIWPKTLSEDPKDTHGDLNSYLEFFERECRNTRAREHVIKTYQDIVDVTVFLQRKDRKDRPRNELRHEICVEYPQLCTSTTPTLEHLDNFIEKLDNSTDFAIRLFFMVKLQNSSVTSRPYATLGESIIYWDDNDTVGEILEREFQLTQTRVHRDREFSALLTAHNLELYGGFRIAWTSNFSEHLRITRYSDFTEIALYHYATILNWHKSCDDLPSGLAEETLRTLALLLPSRDFSGTRYSRLGIDSRAFEHLEDHKRDLRKVDTYSYWRDRLLTLERAFDDSEPASLWQWWYDRRKRREWATFWVAVLVLILTVLFGLIQSVTGIVGAWAAVQQLKQN